MSEINKIYKISYIDRTDEKRHHILIPSNRIDIDVLTEEELENFERDYIKGR